MPEVTSNPFGPFGLLLTDPFCTQKDYLKNICKALVIISRTINAESYIVSLQNLAGAIAMSKNRSDSPAAFQVKKSLCLIDHVKNEMVSLKFRCCVYLITTAILMKYNLSVDDTLFPFIDEVLFMNAADASPLLLFNEMFDILNVSFITFLEKYVSFRFVDSPLFCSNILSLLTKTASARYDDAFHDCWSFLEIFCQKAFCKFNSSIFRDICSTATVLARLSTSQTAVRILTNTTDLLFSQKFSFSDQDGVIVSVFADMLLAIYKRVDETGQKWVCMNLSSQLRRIIPTSPLMVDHLSQNQVDSLINLWHLFRKISLVIENISLRESMTDFIRRSLQFRGLHKRSDLFTSFAELAFSPFFASIFKVDIESICTELLDIEASLVTYDPASLAADSYINELGSLLKYVRVDIIKHQSDIHLNVLQQGMIYLIISTVFRSCT